MVHWFAGGGNLQLPKFQTVIPSSPRNLRRLLSSHPHTNSHLPTDSTRGSSVPAIRNSIIGRSSHFLKVFADLLVDPHQILMVTVALALRTIGYKIEVYSVENGPVYSIWRTIGVPMNILDAHNKTDITVDWFNYDGVLVNSLATKGVVSSSLIDLYALLHYEELTSWEDIPQGARLEGLTPFLGYKLIVPFKLRGYHQGVYNLGKGE